MTVFFLPLPVIQSLNLRYRREKAGLLCMFMLGSLTITSSIVRFAVQDLVVNNLPMCKRCKVSSYRILKANSPGLIKTFSL